MSVAPKLLVLGLAGLVVPAAAVAARPLPQPVVLQIDRQVPIANFMPTQMLAGFSYRGWSYAKGTLTIRFVNRAGSTLTWTAGPMTGTCSAGMQKSFQLAGNKVWWAQSGGAQRAWKCVFAADGVPIRLTASSPTPPTKLADVGLGRIAASGKRY